MGGLSKTLGMNSSMGGFISGLFFLGYTVLQLPAGHLASRSSARRNVMVLSILWGTFSALQGCVTSVTQLIIVRFLLGVVEGGMFPTMYVLVANWFPANERGRASGVFTFYQTLAPLIMSPLSGLILSSITWFGLSSWRWLFILEAIPGICFALVLYFAIADNPQKEKKLKAEERDYLVQALAEEAAKPKVVQDKSYWKAAFRPAFLFLTFAFLSRVIGGYGIQIWMPTILKGISNFDDRTVGFIAAIPWLAATGGTILTGWINDRWNCKRTLIISQEIMAALAYLILYFFGTTNVWLSVGLLTIGITGVASVSSVYFALLPQLITKDMVGGLTGIFAAVGNIGGFVGPFMVGFLMRGGNNMAGMAFLSAMLLISSILIACLNYEPSSAPPSK